MLLSTGLTIAISSRRAVRMTKTVSSDETHEGGQHFCDKPSVERCVISGPWVCVGGHGKGHEAPSTAGNLADRWSGST